MSTKVDTPTRRRVLIVDNHPLIRRGLIDIVDDESDLAVCAAVASYDDAIDAIAATEPDLVITDLSLETDDDGLRLLRYIRKRYGNLPVLVLTMHALPSYTRLALEAGATGYVTKTEVIETLRSAIHHVIDGEIFVNPKFVGEYEIH